VTMSEPTAADLDAEITYLRSTPLADILANQLFVLFQIAAMYLGESPARLADAQLVIDIASSIIKTGDTRLGEHLEIYRTALAELQQAFVRASDPRVN
jgi:hypothetical protein